MVARRTRLTAALLVTALVAAACGAAEPTSVKSDTAPTVRLLFAGDAMLGRRVAPIAAADPDGLFADVRRVIRSADLAAVNVESPLTTRPHASANPYALEADPETARLLGQAGFDMAGLANNHAGDAGRASVLDSIEAVKNAGMRSIGAGSTIDAAWAPVVVGVDGIDVAFLAVDGSEQGVTATEELAGIASWDPVRAKAAIEQARATADVVVVGLHGGVEYRTLPDPLLGPIAEQLAAWGADIVWGHGPHVEQPIATVDPNGDGRPSLIATSLGNFLFDQQTPETSNGLLLEVIVDEDGLVAHRVGDKSHDDLRVHFTGWRVPEGDAAMLAGSWWALDREVVHSDATHDIGAFTEGTVVDASSGDLDGDGNLEVLVSYRHLLRDTPNNSSPLPVDETGRSAHLGVVEPDGTPIWLSRRPPHAIVNVAACDGSATFAYTDLDDDAVIATGAGVWSGFGFVLDDELPGSGEIGCFDVDGDGLLDPVVTDRGGP